MSFVALVARYAKINVNFIWINEIIIYMNVIVIALGCAIAQKYNKHIRLGEYINKNKIDKIGFWIFAVPFIATIVIVGGQYAKDAMIIVEKSAEVGGMPVLFIVKMLVPIFAVSMLLALVEKKQ